MNQPSTQDLILPPIRHFGRQLYRALWRLILLPIVLSFLAICTLAITPGAVVTTAVARDLLGLFISAWLVIATILAGFEMWCTSSDGTQHGSIVEYGSQDH